MGQPELVASPHVAPAAFGGPCINYRYKHKHRKACCGCDPPINVVLSVTNPRDCHCIVNVPVCIPACCTDAPCVDGRCAIFGRGIVTYEWCCGYKLTVTFKRSGDLLVTYFGK